MAQHNCPKCGKPFMAADSPAPQQVGCPSCGAAVSIPPTLPPQGGVPPMPPMYGGLAPAAGEKRAEGLALASFILGITSLFLIGALPAIILGIIALARNTTKKWMAVTGIVSAILLPAVVGACMFGSFMVPTLGRSRELAREAVCQSNLSRMGMGVAMYSASHKEAFPPDLEALRKEGNIPPAAFHCPSNPQPGDSYFYLCPTPKAEDAQKPDEVSVDPKVILACDLNTAHPNGGRAVLFADSTVRFVKTDAEFQTLLADPVNARFAAALKKAE